MVFYALSLFLFSFYLLLSQWFDFIYTSQQDTIYRTIFFGDLNHSSFASALKLNFIRCVFWVSHFHLAFEPMNCWWHVRMFHRCCFFHKHNHFLSETNQNFIACTCFLYSYKYILLTLLTTGNPFPSYIFSQKIDCNGMDGEEFIAINIKLLRLV